MLTDAEVAQFDRDGYVYPVRVLAAGAAGALRGNLEAVERSQGGGLHPSQRAKSHLLFKWLDDLIRDARVLDPVERLIGPDILCWNTIFWIKEAGSKSFVSWHQDKRYWGLSSDKVVTAWLALSLASVESGCMRVMPGSHRVSLAHEDRYQADNMLTRGQEIVAGIDESRAVAMPLATGEMSLHNYSLAHASGPNLSADRRIGVSMHFMPPATRQVIGSWDSAALVRGEDRFGHFAPTPIPARDFDPAAVAFHDKAAEAVRRILYADAAQNPGKL